MKGSELRNIVHGLQHVITSNFVPGNWNSVAGQLSSSALKYLNFRPHEAHAKPFLGKQNSQYVVYQYCHKSSRVLADRLLWNVTRLFPLLYIFKTAISHANNFAMSWTIPGKMLDYGSMRGKKVLASTFIGHYLAWPLFQIWIISLTDMSRPNYRLRFRGYVLLVICLLFRSQSRELSLYIALILLTGNLSLCDLNCISICKPRQWSPSDYDNMNFLKEDILKVCSLWEVSKFCCPGYVENATWFPEPMY